MKKILIALVAIVVIAGPAAAAETAVSPEAEVMKVVYQFLDGFNKGDTKMMLAAGAEQMAILDEFPPHEWHGAGAFAKWMSDFDADAAKHGITDASVSVGKPSHIDVTDADAYVVLKANYSFKRRGKLEEEIGSSLTVTLHQGVDGWRITGWAWAKR
jgi:opacity protein-like surface antigen